MGKSDRYITFDDQTVIDFFYDGIAKFLAQYDNKVIFNEVQKVPEIFSYIKIAVDNDREDYGKFVLISSSQFSFAELINRSYRLKEEWYSSYLTSYLEKDVTQLSQIGDLRDFSYFLNLLTANVTQTINDPRDAKDIGVSVPTIKRWVSVLEASYIVFLLPLYAKNTRKRLVKVPKLYFIDTGLVAYLTRISSKALYESGSMTDALFETYMLSKLYKCELLHADNKKLCYYRTSRGEEVDLIMDHFHLKKLIEIKSSYTYKPVFER